MSEKDKPKKLEYEKIYYFDRTGAAIDESEIKNLDAGVTPLIKACSRLQPPNGFKFYDDFPNMCFNLSNLSCIKNPIVKNVTLPTKEHKCSMECEVVAGYEIRAVGDVQFSISTPIKPKHGYCFPNRSYTCATGSVAVNKVISYTCCAEACAKQPRCIDWAYAYFIISPKEDDCGQCLLVNMGVALEFVGHCECDEE
jgi:hypothetical protein